MWVLSSPDMPGPQQISQQSVLAVKQSIICTKIYDIRPKLTTKSLQRETQQKHVVSSEQIKTHTTRMSAIITLWVSPTN